MTATRHIIGREYGPVVVYTITLASATYASKPYLRHDVAQALCDLFGAFDLVTGGHNLVDDTGGVKSLPAYTYTVRVPAGHSDKAGDYLREIFANIAVRVGDVEWIEMARHDAYAMDFQMRTAKMRGACSSPDYTTEDVLRFLYGSSKGVGE